MFPSIFWSTANDHYSIAGSIPSPLLCGSCKDDGFADISTHIRSRITNPSASTSSDYRYVIFGHDLMCSIAANHNDMRQHRKGMTSSSTAAGGLDLRGKDDSSFLHSIDSRQMVRNLCASQEYFQWDVFLTFTCNMRKHFGTKPIREWLDHNEWTNHYPHWNTYSIFQQEEIRRGLHQSASGLFLRVWEEVSAIFINYLSNSPSSPFHSMLATFARKEYQADVGNLSHIHLLGKIDDLSDRNREELFDLIRNNVIDIIKPEEIDDILEEGLIEHKDDVIEVQTDGQTYLIHTCNSRCLVPDKDGKLICRATNYRKSKENTKHVLTDLPNNFSKPCLERLEEAGIAILERNNDGDIISFKSHLDYFHPKKHIPPWKYGDDNISPCESKTFIICRSMQNVQCLCGAGGSCKYCCKYVAKIDKNNYCTVSASTDGTLIRRANFLHNTKRATSDKVQQAEREKKRAWKHPQGTVISINEVWHHILKYPEVITNLNFVSIPTTPLETRTGKSLRNPDRFKNNNSLPASIDDNTNHDDDENDIDTVKSPNDLREQILSCANRLFTEGQIMTHKDMQLYRTSCKIDLITRFSLRPPELLTIVDMVGKYYRWFHVSSTPLKDSIVLDYLDDDIENSPWIDAMKCQIFLRPKALPELIEWIDSIEHEEGIYEPMVVLFRKLNEVVTNVIDLDDLNDSDRIFLSFAEKHLLYNDDSDEDHLPIPVYSSIKPSMAPEFILSTLLSLGRFSTERELLLHDKLSKCFRHAKLIGMEEDEESLKQYSNQVMYKYISTQLLFFPNGQRIIDALIIQSGDLFDSVIIKNEIPVNDMPVVQLSALLLEHDELFDRFLKEMKNDIVQAAARELGEAYFRCNVPSHNELLNATKDEPLNWDPVSNFVKSPQQSDASFEEQLFAIRVCVQSIDSYLNVMDMHFVKNVIITGFPGGGKTFIMMYIVLYARSKGLNVITCAMMCHRAIQLGGWHWHKLLCIPVDRGNNMSVYRMTEVAIEKLERRHPMRIAFIRSLDMIANDEIGQSPAEIDNVIDNILKLVCRVNVHKGNKFVLATYDPTQLQPVRGRPFLVSPCIIPCYKIVSIKNSVRAQDDNFFRIQQIARHNYQDLIDNSHLIDEFVDLCNGFTFVDNWEDPEITPDTFCIYARNVPAKEASRNFIRSVERIHIEYTKRKCIDLQRRMYSHQEWSSATTKTSTFLDSRAKEQETLCFFKGAIFQCTFNQDGSFSQAQLSLCYDIPSTEDLDNFRRIKMLVFPPTRKYDSFDFDPHLPKDHYIQLGFKEVSISQAPETIYYYDDIKCIRRQYGLRHYVTGTIHSAMGDTYNRMAISVSNVDKLFSLCDRGQLIVILSRTRIMKNTIFVGPKTETIHALKHLLTQRTQWSDYIGEVMKITTISSPQEEDHSSTSTMNQTTFPFRLCDIALPQDQTGCVYFFMSKKDRSYVEIGSSMCIRTTLQKYNAGGYSSDSTINIHMRPYVLIAYICGFRKDRERMEFIKNRWMTDECDNNVLQWAQNATNVIHNDNELKVGYLLKES